MRPYYIIAAAFAILLFLPGVRAIDPPQVSFIPSQISVNSSFIMIADPNAQNFESVSLSWIIPGVDPPWYGSFQKSGSQFACYFSSTDPQSTCGPNMFPYPSAGVPYTVLVEARNQYGQVENVSINVSVGGIPITTDMTVVGNNVYMIARVGAQISGTVSYKAYYADSLTAVPNVAGTMTYVPQIFGYNKTISLPNGEYFITFTASSSSDFGGGVTHVKIGGSGPGTGVNGVYVEPIVYRPVVSAGSPFTLKKFKITNTGTSNLTNLHIEVPTDIQDFCNCQLSIEPESTSLAPNQSTLMTVSLTGIQSSTNISIFATLLSGSDELYQIPVNLDVSVIAGSCSGKQDGTDCLGGICCSNQCQKKANCCIDANCASGQTCSQTTFQCTTSSPTNECEGKTDMETCTGGVCCGSSCRPGGTCCSEGDCQSGYTCSISNTCEPIGNTSGGCFPACTGGKECVSGSCITPTPNDCNPPCESGQECVDGSCITPTPSGGMDITTIALIGGGVAAAVVVGFIVFKKFVKKKGSGDEEELGGSDKEDGDEELSDEDFY